MIAIGDKVRDRITGYEGIVIAVTEWAFNVRNLAVQKQSLATDGTVSDAQWFDDSPRLEIVEVGALKDIKAELPKIKYVMLEKVRDIISMRDGLIIAITTWWSGCIRCTIQTDKMDDNGKPIEMYLSQDQLIPVSSEKPKIPIPKKGGPVNNPRAR